MPKADATGLAPKKSAIRNPPAHNPVREGFWLSLNRTSVVAISLVKSQSGGLGLKNAKTARPLLPGAPNSFVSPGVGIPAFAYTGEYPIPPKAAVTPLVTALS